MTDTETAVRLDLTAPIAAQIMRELNTSKMERSSLRDQEKEFEAQLTGTGVSSQALKIGLRLMTGKKDAETMLDEIETVIRGKVGGAASNVLAQIVDGLMDIKAKRKEIALHEKSIREAAKARGVPNAALAIVQRMQRMDSPERETFFDAIDMMAKHLKFW